jgi:hypothetical protein
MNTIPYTCEEFRKIVSELRLIQVKVNDWIVLDGREFLVKSGDSERNTEFFVGDVEHLGSIITNNFYEYTIKSFVFEEECAEEIITAHAGPMWFQSSVYMDIVVYIAFDGNCNTVIGFKYVDEFNHFLSVCHDREEMILHYLEDYFKELEI